VSRRRIVLASNNAAKMREMSLMLHGSAWDLVAQGEFGVGAAHEPHPTFVENALAKARHASARTEMPALADDSGICVDALNGAPGVLSARFAGDSANEQSNNAELLRRLAGVTDRKAHYTCVLVAIRTAYDAEPLIVEAHWYGEIAQAPRGTGGFGYDPLFYLSALGVTAAELDPAHKNRISHRGLAMQALATKMVGWV